MSPTRAYTWVGSVVQFLQGTATLLALSVPAVDQAFPFVLQVSQIVPSQSLLHLVSGLIGFATLRLGGAGPRRYALWFGLFYVALAIAGALSGHPLGLGLQWFDNSIHAVLGGFGLLAVAAENIRARAA